MMILVGQYDSPFVRRVAVTLHHFGIPFTRNRLSVFNSDMADITIACMIFYCELRLPEAYPSGRYPRLDQIAARCEALEAFIASRPSPDEVMPTRKQ